jgi:dTDP-4-dehydrorhamnose reductase/dTDP-4-dehydrorhamnose 3,5-epimerase
MKIIKTDIEGVLIVEPTVFKDSRGYFFESYNEKEFIRNGITNTFVQDNQSKSNYGVVRGLHCQIGEHAQAKLVRVLQGKVLDVAVDIRKGSKTFGKHVAVELSDENNRQLFIPRGFLHGFSTLSETVVFSYKCDNFYCKSSEFGIQYDDPEIGINWKIPLDKVITSEKDKKSNKFKDLIDMYKNEEKKILVTGGNGQLGTILSKYLPNALFTSSKDLDITNEKDIIDFVKSHNIETIINCAAYTAVDNAEDNIELSTAVNANGPLYLAKTGAKIIHISTDYVFDGKGHKPYSTDDKANPISVYGKTKLAGEKAVSDNANIYVIIRTSWLYSNYGKNFLKTMRSLGKVKESVSVVYDQIGTPTYADDLAEAIIKIIPHLKKENNGIYHFTNEGVCSWYDFATEIMEQSNLKCKVCPISSFDYPTKANRPFYSVLDKSKIKKKFGIEISHWKEGLKKCIKQLE